MFLKITIIPNGFKSMPTELIVSGPDDAMTLLMIFEASRDVNAWKMSDHVPEDFGWSRKSFQKYREESFTREDYNR